jgi:protease I
MNAHYLTEYTGDFVLQKILIPLPSSGADPTEVAIPWKILTQNNCEITFITPHGEKAALDPLMLRGERLGIWKSLLKTRKDAVDAAEAMCRSSEFCSPANYSAVRAQDFDALLLPGGHDKGVKEYLESKTLQSLVVAFFKEKLPVAAICHGVVLAARSIDPDTGKSVIAECKSTALLKSQEMAAFNLTRLWLGDYYLTYPGLTVEDEVTSALDNPNNFITGPRPLLRDSINNLNRGFTVRDGNYLSARWPGDAYSFSLAFLKMLGNC